MLRRANHIIAGLKTKLSHPQIQAAIGISILALSLPLWGRVNYLNSRHRIISDVKTLTQRLRSEELTATSKDTFKKEIIARLSLISTPEYNFTQLLGEANFLESQKFQSTLIALDTATNLERQGVLLYGTLMITVTGSLLALSALASGISLLLLQWRSEVTESEENVREAEAQVEQEARASTPAWYMARATLEQYYTRNLNQIRLIFLTSIVAMGLGFALICGCIIWSFVQQENNNYLDGTISIEVRESTIDSLIVGNPNEQADIENDSEKDQDEPESQGLNIAIIGVAAGIITNFIGATFLFLYQSTIKQASEYATSLEQINAVGMSMYILDGLQFEELDPTLHSNLQKTIVEAKVQIATLILAGKPSEKSGPQTNTKSDKSTTDKESKEKNKTETA